MIKQKGLVPKRRFAGFHEEWKKQKLEKVLDLLKDGTHGTHQNVKDGIYLLSAKNIKNGNVNFDKSDRKISLDEYRAIHRNFNLKKGDVLLTVVGSIGESAILKFTDKFTFQRSVAYLRPNEEITTQYLFTTINSMDFQKELKDRQVVSAQPGIYLGDLSVIPIFYPALKEQQKIGQFFKHLDEMIALQQRKIDKTKALKSAYLAEMFPAEGERVPKRRFEGFTDKWEERKLDTVADIISGGTPSTINSKYWNGNIDWYTPAEIGNHVYAQKSLRTITKLGLEKSSAKILPPDKTILFTSRAGIGDMAILKKPGTTNQGFQSIVLKENIDTYFIYSMGYLIKKYAMKNASGSTFLEISGKPLGNMRMLLPSFKEQQKIGRFFKKIDETILNHQQKLEKLKATKEAYLHEMFV